MIFKVLIVGAGPAGLCLAHSLRLANIDYTIIDRRKTFADGSGATIVLLPHGMRLMHQFGLLEKTQQNATRLVDSEDFGRQGELLPTKSIFLTLEENHGYPIMLFSRPNLIKTLSEGIPDLTNRSRLGGTIEKVDMNPNHVLVELSDGTVERGSIIIGADGVHSTLRKLIIMANPGALNNQAEFTDHSFKILYGRSRATPNMSSTKNKFLTRHSDGWFMQLGCEDEEGCWVLYEAQEDERRHGPATFSQTDIEAFKSKYRNVVFSERHALTIGHIMDESTFTYLDWMDEGLSTSWSFQRAVFIGDAAVKVNPSMANGGNIALESAATLANEIHTLLQTSPEPSLIAVSAAFQSYYDSRKVKMMRADRVNRTYARTNSWQHLKSYYLWHLIMLLSRWRRTFFPDLIVAPWMRRSSKLDYVQFDEKVARVPWLDIKESNQPEGGIWVGLCMVFWLLLGYRPY